MGMLIWSCCGALVIHNTVGVQEQRHAKMMSNEHTRAGMHNNYIAMHIRSRFALIGMMPIDTAYINTFRMYAILPKRAYLHLANSPRIIGVYLEWLEASSEQYLQ